MAVGGASMTVGPVRRCWRSGFTLLESMIAMLVLTIAVAGLVAALDTGWRALSQADEASRGAALGERLIEEIVSRPYSGSGASRAEWCVDDYDGLHEVPGELADTSGALLPDAMDQAFARSCTVVPDTLAVPGLVTNPLPGKSVVVFTTGPSGHTWQFERFIAEPGDL